MIVLSVLQVVGSLLGLFYGGWVFLTRSLFDEVQGRDTLVQVDTPLAQTTRPVEATLSTGQVDTPVFAQWLGCRCSLHWCLRSPSTY